MATAGQIIESALKRILVQPSEAPIEPDEYQDGIDALNRMMLALDADGVQLGFTEVTSTASVVTTPIGALRGIIANLAIELSPDFGGQVTQELRDIAKAGLVTMRKLGTTVTASALPSTLPRGSGNEGAFSPFISPFYPNQEQQILAETTGAIGLETETSSQSS